MFKFKVGDRVLLNPVSQYWGQSDDGPGTVTSVNDTVSIDRFRYNVEWDKNGDNPRYHESDLLLEIGDWDN